MARTHRKSITNSPVTGNPGEGHSDDDDIYDDGDIASISGDADKDASKRDARRKIEIYWEKKRLRDQFEDFDESEVDF